MKDLDFDELDRAVSSVMGQPTPEETQLDDATTQTQPTTPVTPVDSAEDTVAPVSTPSREAVVVPAARRTGRFMDVMHPSSDMKTADMAPSREGVAITPPSESTTLNESSIDDTQTTEVQAVPAVADPLSSPFLPDAQVEKRPLGGLNSFNDQLARELAGAEGMSIQDEEALVEETPVEEMPVAIPDASTESSDDEAEADLQVAPTPLPAELNSDLVAIESGEVQAGVSTGGAITQQYIEQPSTGDQSHTPIYDTEATAQPLAHPASKKSGWLVVVAIIACALLGIGGTIAAYYAGLI